MADPPSIQVDFGRPMPLFPLNGVTLFPQQVLPLHVFEPRYRQMVRALLDGSGQFAMATFAGEEWKKNYHGRPRVRRVVCIGQIAQHESIPGEEPGEERYNVLLQGICRARILRELPAQEGKLYREAMLEPVGLEAAAETKLTGVRQRLERLLSDGPLTHMRAAEPLLEFIQDSKVPTTALLEVVSFTLLGEAVINQESRYQLLAEPDASERARMIVGHLGDLSSLISRARSHRPTDAPKGCSWN